MVEGACWIDKKSGFTHLSSDAALFIFDEKEDIAIAVVYVDDTMFFGKNLTLVMKEKQESMDKWECHNLGEVKEFLHMHIKCQGSKVLIHQTVYLERVLLRFERVNAKIVPTLLPSGYVPSENTKDVDHELCSLFQQVIGSLLYMMLGTHPDITYVCCNQVVAILCKSLTETLE